ncbi:MAG: carboxypeptidase-like regulatory domain-containing protein [Tenacibaculum sp.]
MKKNLCTTKWFIVLLIIKFKIRLSIIFVFLILFPLQPNETYAQQNRISINEFNITLKQFLDRLEKNTPFDFAYKINDVNNLKHTLNANLEKENINTVLNNAFSQTKIEHNTIKNKVYLTKSKKDFAFDFREKKAYAPIVQRRITGVVFDQNGQVLPGVNIVEKGTANGTITDWEGSFSLILTKGDTVLQASYIGYETVEVNLRGKSTLKIIMIESDSSLKEITVYSVADIADGRKTPIATKTFKADFFQDKLSTNQITELLNSSPSVYGTKGGGGYGDGELYIRGFDQKNFPLMLNGIYVNSAVDGRVFYNNWIGFFDVLNLVEVQRGLGTSKLAVPSLGGTVNMLSQTAQQAQKGYVKMEIGSNKLLKSMIKYSSGMLNNGWSYNFLFGTNKGAGNFTGGDFESLTYFVSLGYNPNDKHSFELLTTGTAQIHNIRNAQKLLTFKQYGQRYNENYGFLSNKPHSALQNYYFKPLFSLNYNWHISHKSKLATSVYYIDGEGGVSVTVPFVFAYYDNGLFKPYEFRDPKTGLILFDDIIRYNRGAKVGALLLKPTWSGPDNAQASFTGKYVTGSSFPFFYSFGSSNVQRDYGIVSNFEQEIFNNLNLSIGIDIRDYKSNIYQKVVDKLGNDAVYATTNANNTGEFITQENKISFFENVSDDVKIDRDHLRKIRWIGAHAQIEYTDYKLSAYVQGVLNKQFYRRIDNINYIFSDPNHDTGWKGFYNSNMKLGFGYYLIEKHNLYANFGYLSKLPLMETLFPNRNFNQFPDRVNNENIYAYELGYKYFSSNFKLGLNLYYTLWNNRYLTNSTETNYITWSNYGQRHKGVEVDVKLRPTNHLKIDVMLSLGNWIFNDNVTVTNFDRLNNKSKTQELFIDNLKVGNAAQTRAHIGLDYKPIEGLKTKFICNYFADLFAQISPKDEQFLQQGAKVLKLPSFYLVDFDISYRLKLNTYYSKSALKFGVSVSNLFNKSYIAQLQTNKLLTDLGAYKDTGIGIENEGFIGIGSLWSVYTKLEF